MGCRRGRSAAAPALLGFVAAAVAVLCFAVGPSRMPFVSGAVRPNARPHRFPARLHSSYFGGSLPAYRSFDRRFRSLHSQARTTGTSDQKPVCVLFDFDGTIGNTESVAMELCFWELAPYMCKIAPENLEKEKLLWMENNVGQPFEHMLERIERDREEQGLDPIESVRERKMEPEEYLEVVNKARARFDLPTIHNANYPSLLTQQKEECVSSLRVLATPVDGMKNVLDELNELKVPYCICTTSGKPRVPVCVETLGFDGYFPPHKIHSGESDFTPSRFKPMPDVYLRGAESENYDPQDCICVEDSASGVGSGANAKLGFIIGYVGATHIAMEKKESQAEDLLSGRKSEDRRGANIVIENMSDIVPLIKFFLTERIAGRSIPDGKISTPVLNELKGKYYLKGAYTPMPMAS